MLTHLFLTRSILKWTVLGLLASTPSQCTGGSRTPAGSSGSSSSGSSPSGGSSSSGSSSSPLGFAKSSYPAPKGAIGIIVVPLGNVSAGEPDAMEKKIQSLATSLKSQALPTRSLIVTTWTESTSQPRKTCHHTQLQADQCLFGYLLGWGGRQESKLDLGTANGAQQYIAAAWHGQRLNFSWQPASSTSFSVEGEMELLGTFPAGLKVPLGIALRETTVDDEWNVPKQQLRLWAPDDLSQVQISAAFDLAPYVRKDRAGWVQWELGALQWQKEEPLPTVKSNTGVVLYTVGSTQYMVWTDASHGNDMRVGTIIESSDPNVGTSLVPSATQLVISPNNGNAIGSEAAPSVTRHKGKTYLAWTARGADAKVRLLKSTDPRWRDHNSVIPLQSTGAGPAIASTQQWLVVAYRGVGSDNALYVTRSDDEGASWTVPNKVLQDGVAPHDNPAMAAIGDKLLLVHKTDWKPGFRAIFSENQGASWAMKEQLTIPSGKCGSSKHCAPFILPVPEGDRCSMEYLSKVGNRFYLFTDGHVQALSMEHLDSNVGGPRPIQINKYISYTPETEPPQPMGPVLMSAAHNDKNCRFLVVGGEPKDNSSLIGLSSPMMSEIATTVFFDQTDHWP